MSQPSSLQVGAASGAVDVPPGTPMSGFAARTGPSLGVHDPTTVRVLVIDRTALVAVDCCALHERSCALIRERCLAEGLVDEVVVAATHTHSGPAISEERLGHDQPAIREQVVQLATALVDRAASGAVPAQVHHGAATGVGVARDRRHLDRTIDPPLQALWFTAPDGHRVATLVSYPCHPVALDGSNRLISADYPHPLRQRVEAAHPGSLCLFFTGAAGDVNTGHTAAASFVVRSDAAPGRSFADADRIGEQLARAVLALPDAPLDVPDGCRSSSAQVELALRELDPDQVAEQASGWRLERDLGRAEGRGDDPLLDAWIDWAEQRDPEPARSWTGRVSLTRLGPLAIVGLPGEPFLTAAEQLSAVSSGPVITLGYCDGVPGYLPALADQFDGGYEVDDAHRYYGMPAPFVAGSLERLIAAATALLLTPAAGPDR